MHKKEICFHFQGRELHRLILSPRGKPERGMVFFHGQGDYIDRYPDVLEPFVDAGIEVILTDLPGHGKSMGRRGAVPGMAFVDDLMEESLERFSKDMPLGIAGHSMGGHLALRGLFRNPDRYSFAWFSSPLLEPSYGVSYIRRSSLMLLARFLPWLSWSTGVKSSDCRSDDEPTKKEDPSALYHSRITLEWARQLLLSADEMREEFPTLPRDRPILFTQGELDPVCPAELLRNRIRKLPKSQLRYREIAGGLHEPFMGDTAEEFRKELSQWVRDSLSLMV